MGGPAVRQEDAIDAIMRVLQRHAELQVNLASTAARVQIAKAILSEIEESVPGFKSLRDTAVLPPYSDMTRGEF
jgi:hypothetical protein